MADTEYRSNLMTRLMEMKEWKELEAMINERVKECDDQIVQLAVEGKSGPEANHLGQRRDELTRLVARVRRARVMAPK